MGSHMRANFVDMEFDPILMRRIAVKHLVGEALAWWNIIVKEVDAGVMTWVDFMH